MIQYCYWSCIAINDRVLYICEFLGVTPQQFFDQDNNYPAPVNELLQYAKSMKKENVEILLDVAKRFI